MTEWNGGAGPRIVAIGGGTGLSTMLRGLKSRTRSLTAIVTVADDGGGSGMLRQDLGMPPPGDIRHCMEALANAEPMMQQLLTYRFPEGSGNLTGQSFGNLILTSPNPLTLICSKKEDGSTNLAPICFVSYLSFNPPMVGFATGKQSHTGKQVRETDKVIVTVPGESLAQTVIACGASTGAKTDKVAANNIEMMAVEGSDIQIPVDTRLAMVATLQQSVEVGDHILHICQVDKFLGDEDKKGLYAWNGFGKVAPAVEG